MIDWHSILGPAGIEFVDWNIPASSDLVDPVGVIIHHHGSLDDEGFDSRLNFVKFGPIAPYYHLWHNTGMNDDGQGEGHVNALTRGKANHAGKTDAAHLERIANGERVDERPDLPRVEVVDGHPDYITLNTRFYGLCLEGPPHTDEQIAACVRSAAAVCNYHDWDPHIVIMGHKESAAPLGRKSDPIFDMGWFRDSVEGEMMALTPEEQERILAVLPRVEAYFAGMDAFNATQPDDDQTSAFGQGRWVTPMIRQHTRDHEVDGPWEHPHIYDRINEHSEDPDAHHE